MILADIQQALQQAFSDCRVEVEEKEGHYYVTVIGDRFADQSPVKRQQTVYEPLNPFITSGELHAVHITVKTETEWNNS